MNSRSFSLKRLAKSFSFAWRGLRLIWHSEPNFRFHFFFSLLIIACGFFFRISPIEWIAITFCIGSVMSAEAMNTAVEVLADTVQREPHPLIAKAKDAAAGAVLLVSLATMVVGGIIFLPKLWAWITRLMEN